jgi:transcriptional regulator GlxA family with amidase domain
MPRVMAQKNVRGINWIKQAASEAKYITSHCQGAFLLGKEQALTIASALIFGPSNIEASITSK